MDRYNKFTEVKQGIIRIENSYSSPSGMGPKIRVINGVGYIDMWINNMVIPEQEFDATFETLYNLWEEELTKTIEVLTPQSSECVVTRMCPEDLRQLLHGVSLEPMGEV
tara:strand:- start:248 stop:574 length:327 start_codon:yes stop_codon:yes gene_type:complete